MSSDDNWLDSDGIISSNIKKKKKSLKNYPVNLLFSPNHKWTTEQKLDGKGRRLAMFWGSGGSNFELPLYKLSM